MFTVTATDIAGHTFTDTRTYHVRWPFTGFFSPIDNPPVYNVVKAGAAVPVKFSLGGNRGLSIFLAGFPVSVHQASCTTGAPTDTIEQTLTAGASSLQYDPGSNQYVYVWKTSSAFAAGSCRILELGLKDGSDHRAYFKFK